MATTSPKINDAKIVKLIQKGTSIPKASIELGTTTKVMAAAYYRLEPVADPSLVITGTKVQVNKAIVAGRKLGLRWERLSARTGLKVSEVKDRYEQATGTTWNLNYCGKGRHYEKPTATPKPKATRKATPKPKATPKTRKPATRKPATAKS